MNNDSQGTNKNNHPCYWKRYFIVLRNIHFISNWIKWMVKQTKWNERKERHTKIAGNSRMSKKKDKNENKRHDVVFFRLITRYPSDKCIRFIRSIKFAFSFFVFCYFCCLWSTFVSLSSYLYFLHFDLLPTFIYRKTRCSIMRAFRTNKRQKK